MSRTMLSGGSNNQGALRDIRRQPDELRACHRQKSRRSSIATKDGAERRFWSSTITAETMPEGCTDEPPEKKGFSDVTKWYQTFPLLEILFGPWATPQRKRRVVDASLMSSGWLRVNIYRFIHSAFFSVFIGAITFLNMVVIILEVDMMADLQSVPAWIEVTTMAITWTYVLDSVMKVFALRWFFMVDMANVFDAAIVLLDLIGLLWIQISGDTNIPSLLFLRSLRLLRVYHLVKSMMVFRELVLMMQGLKSALRAIVFGASLVFLALTMWSILAVQFLQPLVRALVDQGEFVGCNECETAFDSVIKANITLWQTIVAGDSWGVLAVPLMTHFPKAGLILIPAFISVELGLVNVIVAVIVDRQSAAREDDDDLTYMVHQENLKSSFEKLRTLFAELDDDSGGGLTLDELQRNYETNHEFRSLLNVLDIERSDIPTVYDIMDFDDSGDVSYGEFVEKLHQIKFVNSHTLLMFIKQHVDVMRRDQHSMRETFDGFIAKWGCMVQKLESAEALIDASQQKNSPFQKQTSSESFQTVEQKSSEAFFSQDEFAIEELQKQLYNTISSIMMPAVAHVVGNFVSSASSTRGLIPATGSRVESRAFVADAAPVESLNHRADSDMRHGSSLSFCGDLEEEEVTNKKKQADHCPNILQEATLQENWQQSPALSRVSDVSNTIRTPTRSPALALRLRAEAAPLGGAPSSDESVGFPEMSLRRVER